MGKLSSRVKGCTLQLSEKQLCSISSRLCQVPHSWGGGITLPWGSPNSLPGDCLVLWITLWAGGCKLEYHWAPECATEPGSWQQRSSEPAVWMTNCVQASLG